MEPDGDGAEAAEVSGALDLVGGNRMMPGERSGENDLTWLQRSTPFDQVS